MKLLVAEDNIKMQSMLTALLEKEGFVVSRAGGGKEALRQYAATQPDILCLDVLMDDMSGLEVCKEIRKTDKKVSIIMVTSKSEVADMAEGIAAGADEYIVKPYDFSDIVTMIREVARRCIARDNPALYGESFNFGDIRVFPGQLRAQRGDAGFDLNFRDVEILKLFLAHPGKTVDSETLRKFCWESPTAVARTAVDWQISQLRRKIEIDSEKPLLIRSAAGGYSFFWVD